MKKLVLSIDKYKGSKIIVTMDIIRQGECGQNARWSPKKGDKANKQKSKSLIFSDLLYF